MTGDRFLEIYGGQTTEELLAMAGEYRIDSLVLAFEQAIQGKPDPISREERFVLAVEALEREVNNGGYGQFFLNSSHDFLDVMDEALTAIGCPKTAAITRDAVAALKSEGQAAGKALAACDERYFDNDEPIAERLFEWIGRNRAAVRVGEG